MMTDSSRSPLILTKQNEFRELEFSKMGGSKDCKAGHSHLGLPLSLGRKENGWSKLIQNFCSDEERWRGKLLTAGRRVRAYAKNHAISFGSPYDAHPQGDPKWHPWEPECLLDSARRPIKKQELL